MYGSSRFQFLKNRHQGQRVVLVANGPSLNKMNLSFLKDEITIGLNKIYLGFNTFCFYPRYYVAVNDKVIVQSAEQIKQLSCVKFISDRNAQLIPETALTYHINTSISERFSYDISRGVGEGWTVTYAALQIAFYLGFSEVILIGMDHRYEYSGLPNEACRMDGPDLNHFSKDYFGYGKTWDNPDLANSEESYRIAREIFKQAGRRIIDATLDGACTVFEKVLYQNLFEVKG